MEKAEQLLEEGEEYIFFTYKKPNVFEQGYKTFLDTCKELKESLEQYQASITSSLPFAKAST